MERKRRRMGKRKLEEISLLEFSRHLLELIFKNHSESSGILVQEISLACPKTLTEIRFDSSHHQVKMLTVQGICKLCKGRSTYCCIHCDVALHPELCFYKFHAPQKQWEDV
jgi:hypothetical protein